MVAVWWTGRVTASSLIAVCKRRGNGVLKDISLGIATRLGGHMPARVAKAVIGEL